MPIEDIACVHLEHLLIFVNQILNSFCKCKRGVKVLAMLDLDKFSTLCIW